MWLSVDPLAEKYPGISPYAYALNNPIKFIDADGRIIGDPNSEDALRLRQVMMKTKTGRKIWNEMESSNRVIYIVYAHNEKNSEIFNYLKGGGADGQIVTKKMYDDILSSGYVSSNSYDSSAKFNENTGEYDKTSDWNTTYILLNEAQITIENELAEIFNGEKAKILGDIRKGGEEAAHSLQDYMDFYKKIFNPQTKKYEENNNKENEVPYENRRHEAEAKQEVKKMENELLGE